ncbi:MAG: potassium channel family protein [Planctomycetota bacterium]
MSSSTTKTETESMVPTCLGCSGCLIGIALALAAVVALAGLAGLVPMKLLHRSVDAPSIGFHSQASYALAGVWTLLAALLGLILRRPNPTSLRAWLENLAPWISIALLFLILLLDDYGAPNLGSLAFLALCLTGTALLVVRGGYHTSSGWLFQTLALWIGFVAAALFAFALRYWHLGVLDADGEPVFRLADSLYFSIVTWTSLGFGDIQPSEHVRLVVCGEALMGYTLMGVLLVFVTQVLMEFSQRSRMEQIRASIARYETEQDELFTGPYGAPYYESRKERDERDGERMAVIQGRIAELAAELERLQKAAGDED